MTTYKIKLIYPLIPLIVQSFRYIKHIDVYTKQKYCNSMEKNDIV